MRYGCNHVYVLMCSSLSRGEVSTHAFLNVNAVFHGCIKDHIVHCTAHGEFLTQRFAGKALSSTLVFGFATGPGTLRIVEIQNIIITKYMLPRLKSDSIEFTYLGQVGVGECGGLD